MTTDPTATLTINGASEEVRGVCCEFEPGASYVNLEPFPPLPVHVNCRCKLDYIESKRMARYLRRLDARKRQIEKRVRALLPHWKSHQARHLARLPWFFDLSQYGYRSRDKIPRGVRQNLRHGPPVAMLEWDIGGATPTMEGV